MRASSSEELQRLMVSEHEKTLSAIAEAKAEVSLEFAPRIAALESLVAGRAAPAAVVVAVAQELSFLEYAELPMNVVSKKEPLEARVVSVKRVIGASAPGEISHVVLDTRGKLPYVEGQSLGVLPSGLDEKGREYQQRLYSIASTRYGDDGTGTSVSLCVRRAVFADPETGLEDPAKKGVCSNALCDASVGDVVRVTGPTGKGMLLPEDAAADIIMVATGTGIAPYRSFIRRLFVERTPAAALFRGRASLYLGVPTTTSLLYADEWAGVAAAHPNFDHTYAISREETNAEGGRMYIQDRIREVSDDIFQRLDAGAHIYFCGLKGMMPGIESTLKAAADASGRDWPTFLKALKKSKTWHVEVY